MSLLTIAQAQSAKSNAGSNAPQATFLSTPTNGRKMLACIVAEEGSSDVTISLAGWTLIKSVNNSTNEVMSVYQKTAGASEPTTVTGSLTGVRRWVMWIAELDQADATLVDISDISSGTSNLMVSNSIATSFPDEHWFAFFGAKGNVNMGSPTNGFTEILESATNNGVSPDVTLGVYDKDVSATGTAQCTVTASTSVKYATIILAVKSVPSAVTYTKSGTVISGGSVAKGADVATHQETGTVISTHNVSGARASLGLSKFGIVIADSDSQGGFGADNFGTANFGAGSQHLSGVAVKIQASGAKTGSVISTGVFSGADVSTHQETGNTTSGSVLSGPDVSTHQETGKAVSAGISSGSSLLLHPGKTGTVTSNGLIIAGPDADIHPRTGTVISTSQFSGSDAHTAVRTGKIVSAFKLSGNTAGPEHPEVVGTYLLPYNVDPPIRKDEYVVIGAEDHERSY